jgi:phosphopantothenoylcysteine decarboxylase / phosphopantothenate---cysteine ligase
MVQRYGTGVRSSYRARITQKADNRAMQGKRILLGVTGGIAAYKSADLVRRLVEHGAEVQVVMTAAAREFVTPITFQALSGRAVRTDLWDAAAEAAMGHIELARWAQLVLVAPASADFLARLAHGLADDLLTTLCLATEAPIAVAPAMNQLMWRNAATRSNVELLRARGVRLIGPGVGDQACGEHGPGRLVEPIEIVAQIAPLLAPAGPLTGRRVLLTAGPTRECIDPVRFVSNRSSGKMGFAMAQAMRAAGAQVVLVSGPVSLPTPPGVRRIDVESAEQMYTAVQRELPGTAIFIGTAAVADYRPVACAPQKIKKNSETLALELTRTTDILSQVSASAPRPFMVGFAAETNAVEHYARAKLLAKNLDLIAANEVGHTKAFDCDENSLLVLWRGGRVELPVASKQELARALTGVIVEQYLAQQDGAPRGDAQRDDAQHDHKQHEDATLASLEDARAS